MNEGGRRTTGRGEAEPKRTRVTAEVRQSKIPGRLAPESHLIRHTSIP